MALSMPLKQTAARDLEQRSKKTLEWTDTLIIFFFTSFIELNVNKELFFTSSGRMSKRRALVNKDHTRQEGRGV